MPMLIIAEKGKPMDTKKKGFLSYGKEEEPEAESEGGGEEEASADAGDMRLQHLAEQTGVENPKALVKLVKACIDTYGE